MFSTSLVGSLFHLSPEQIEGKVYSGEKIDIWALGVVLYRMIIGKPPFFDKNVNKFVENIKEVKLEYPEGLQISEEAKELMDLIFKYEPSKRISCDDILRHKWVVIGERGKPSLDRVEIILGDPGKIDQEDAWKVLCYIIKNKMNMTFHEKSSKNLSNIIKTCNCIYPPKDLKLSIQMKAMENNSGTPSPFNILLHTISSSSTLTPKNGFTPKVSSSPKTTAPINIEIKSVIVPKHVHSTFFTSNNPKSEPTIYESSLEYSSSKEDISSTYISLQKSKLSNSKQGISKETSTHQELSPSLHQKKAIPQETSTPQEISPQTTPLNTPQTSYNQIVLPEISLETLNEFQEEIKDTPSNQLVDSNTIISPPFPSENKEQEIPSSYPPTKPPLIPSNLLKNPNSSDQEIPQIKGTAEVYNLDSKVSLDTLYSQPHSSSSSHTDLDLNETNGKSEINLFQNLKISNQNTNQSDQVTNPSDKVLSSSLNGFSLNLNNPPKSNLIDTPLLNSLNMSLETPSLKRNSSTSRSYFFIFDLREGDCWDFINAIERIKSHFSNTYQLYISGKLQDIEEETKDYCTSEPVLTFSEISSLSVSPKKKSNKTIKSKNKKSSKEEESSVKLKKSKDEESSPSKAKSSVISIPISGDENKKQQKPNKNWKSTSTGGTGFITRDAKIPSKKNKKMDKEEKEDSN